MSKKLITYISLIVALIIIVVVKVNVGLASNKNIYEDAKSLSTAYLDAVYNENPDSCLKCFSPEYKSRFIKTKDYKQLLKKQLHIKNSYYIKINKKWIKSLKYISTETVLDNYDDSQDTVTKVKYSLAGLQTRIRVSNIDGKYYLSRSEIHSLLTLLSTKQ